MKISAGRQRREMRPNGRNRLRLGLGVSACSATIALMPVSALALTSAVNHPTLCTACKPAAAFDRAGVLANRGTKVHLSGPVDCSVGDTVSIRATVSQLATGAVAEGVWSKRCTGTTLHWHITALVNGGVHFSTGSAEGVGLAVIRDHRVPVSAIQWIRVLTLT
jgi:hypothetical protein